MASVFCAVAANASSICLRASPRNAGLRFGNGTRLRFGVRQPPRFDRNGLAALAFGARQIALGQRALDRARFSRARTHPPHNRARLSSAITLRRIVMTGMNG